MEKWDRVRITSGKYEGQTATIVFSLGNGAMVERDEKEERRFCLVMFEHLEPWEPLKEE